MCLQLAQAPLKHTYVPGPVVTGERLGQEEEEEIEEEEESADVLEQWLHNYLEDYDTDSESEDEQDENEEEEVGENQAAQLCR